METRIADLSDLNDLQRLVIGFRDQLRRSEPNDAALREGLRRMLTMAEAEFMLAIDGTRGAVGYIQQRYRYSLWLGDLEATLEDLFVDAASRRQGVATRLVQFAIARAKP